MVMVCPGRCAELNLCIAGRPQSYILVSSEQSSFFLRFTVSLLLVENCRWDFFQLSFNDGFRYSIKAGFMECITKRGVELCSSSRVTMGHLAASLIQTTLINALLPPPISLAGQPCLARFPDDGFNRALGDVQSLGYCFIT
ncbi:hypothetical protein ILYODFUR_001094 [Ilyodon furcidens]|uniref:Uncharacterized protein n=1 Tax=Ilyodon furcidens TaxID=33524 RepID=A0ABV0T4A6_9TELE